jgi:hypothetical protein
MSDTYIVKYLPIKGKPEVGDRCKHSITKFIGILEYWNSQKMGKRDEGYYLVSNTEFQGVSKSYLEKVEPFLCSKDVKVRDIIPEGEIIDIETDPWGREVVIWQKGNISGSEFKYKLFKVIGKTSSGACVKDGDVFEEDQLGHYYKTHGHVKSTNELSLEKTPKDYIIYIKCPWGHYH